MNGPTVSVLMANFNGASFIEGALASVLNQTLADLEIVVVDDGSTDDSVARITAVAATDARVRLFRREASGGPAAARNLALDQARGRWLAIVDSDDLIHRDRIARLVDHATRDAVDIAIDDLLIFSEAGAAKPFFRKQLARRASSIDLASYVASNRLFGRAPALGFAKPLIRREALDAAGVRYDEGLIVAEDYDLIARLLHAGLRMRAYPELTYFYRKHAASISHRLDLRRLDAMRESATRFRALTAEAGPDVRAAQDRRDASIASARAFTVMVSALKARDARGFLDAARRTPAALALFRMPLLDRLKRLMPRAPVARGDNDVVVLSQQRVVGHTNGSSRYLLDLCAALKGAGRKVRFIGPSPKAFGSWPILRLRSETDVFSSLEVRGGRRIGRWLIATHPAPWLAAARFAFQKLTWGRRPLQTPPSVGSAPTREDLVFIANRARGARFLLADYGFCAPLAAYALAPAAPVVTVMHDLFSARKDQFEPGRDSVTDISEAHERRLLDQSDVIIAIQQAEQAKVQAWLPDRRVILAPMAPSLVAKPQPGQGGGLLFVGSNTAPNVTALEWFFAQAWPRIRQVRPSTQLLVVGTVHRAMGRAPEGVRFVGLARDLSPLYRDADLVISPLIAGSGLKIKLIEALGQGKAVVATSVTLQGVEDALADVVARADDADAFADAVLSLLDDPARRATLGARALGRMQEQFSPEICYRPLTSLVAPGSALDAAQVIRQT